MLDRVLKDQSDDLVITEPGTVVKDKTVAGDVIIAASVGSGDVTLDNVTIHGDLLVKGGGANSVHLKDTKVKGTVYAQRTAGTVRIVVEAATQLDRVVVLNGTHLQAASDFKGTIKEVVIDEQASSTQAITIDAKTDKVEIQANVAVTIKEAVSYTHLPLPRRCPIIRISQTTPMMWSVCLCDKKIWWIDPRSISARSNCVKIPLPPPVSISKVSSPRVKAKLVVKHFVATA